MVQVYVMMSSLFHVIMEILAILKDAKEAKGGFTCWSIWRRGKVRQSGPEQGRRGIG